MFLPLVFPIFFYLILTLLLVVVVQEVVVVVVAVMVEVMVVMVVAGWFGLLFCFYVLNRITYSSRDRQLVQIVYFSLHKLTPHLYTAP